MCIRDRPRFYWLQLTMDRAFRSIQKKENKGEKTIFDIRAKEHRNKVAKKALKREYPFHKKGKRGKKKAKKKQGRHRKEQHRTKYKQQQVPHKTTNHSTKTPKTGTNTSRAGTAEATKSRQHHQTATIPNPGNHTTGRHHNCLLYTSPSPRDQRGSRMPSSA